MLHAWFILTIAMWLTTYLVHGFRVTGLWNTIVVAALFGTLNFFFGWFIRLGLVVGTLGLGYIFWFITRWIANAIILEVTAWVSPRVKIESFGSALAASALMSIVGAVVDWAIINHHNVRFY